MIRIYILQYDVRIRVQCKKCTKCWKNKI